MKRRFWIPAILLACIFSSTGYSNPSPANLFEGGLKKKHSGNFEDAALLFREAADSTGKIGQKTTFLFALADLFKELGKFRESAETFQEIVDLDDKNSIDSALYGQAGALLLANRVSEAEDACKRLVRDYPDSKMLENVRYLAGINPESLAARFMVLRERGSVEANAPPASPFSTQPESSLTPREEKSETLDPQRDSDPYEPAPIRTMSIEPVPFNADPSETTPNAAASLKKIPDFSTPPGLPHTEYEADLIESGQIPFKSPYSDIPENETSSQPSLNRWEANAGIWSSDLAGDLEAKGMNLELDTQVDFNPENRVFGNIAYRFNEEIVLAAKYQGFDHSGGLNQTVTFDKVNYSTNANLSIETQVVDVEGRQVVINEEHAFGELVLGVRGTKHRMVLEEWVAKGLQSGDLNTNLFIPYLGVEGQGKITSHLWFYGGGRFFSAHAGKAEGRLSDLEFGLMVGKPPKYQGSGITGTLGYRHFTLHGSVDDNSVGSEYSGPTFSLNGKF